MAGLTYEDIHEPTPEDCAVVDWLAWHSKWRAYQSALAGDEVDAEIMTSMATLRSRGWTPSEIIAEVMFTRGG